jgi:ferredoxin-NADP reductase
MIKPSFSLSLESFEEIAPRVRHFKFSTAKPIDFIPGQFITLQWVDQGIPISRSYSLANYSTDPKPLLELAAAYVEHGFASERLFNMHLGDTVTAIGPKGRLILTDEPVKHYYLIATGTGVTPYIAMLPSLKKRMQADPALCVSLLFGVRYPQDLLYRDQLIDFAKNHPQFTLQIYYSRAQQIDCKENYEHTGYVTQALKKWNIHPEHERIYLCGNPQMIDDAYFLLCDQGCKPEHIRKEKYTRSKPQLKKL